MAGSAAWRARLGRLARLGRGGTRVRIGFAFSLLALVIFGAIAALSASEARRQSEREAAAALQQVADRLAQHLDADMAARYREVAQIALLTSMLMPELPPQEWRRVLEDLKASVPHYSWIGLANPEGRVLAATSRLLEGRDVSQRPWFHDGKRRPAVGDVHEAKLLAQMLPAMESGEPLRFVDVAAPVKQGGTVVGVIGGHLSWQWAEARRTEALNAVAGGGGIEIVLVNQRAAVELGPRQPALPAGGEGLAALARAPAMLTWSDGQDYLSAVSASKPVDDYPGMGWAVVVRQPEHLALAAATALQWRLLWLGAAGVLVFGLGGWVLADRLTRSLRHLALQAQATGHATPQPALLDEVDQLAASLATLLDDLNRREAELRAWNQTLEARVQKRTASLQQANEDLRSFSRSVSHDLRAPLGMLSLLLRQLLEREGASLSERGLQTLDTAACECDRLSELARELLTLAMVEESPLNSQLVDSRAIVGEVVAQLVATQPALQPQVFDIGTLPQVWGDPVLLRQVWANLLANAAKFSSRRAAPRIKVRARQDGTETVFEVADNGVGFDASQAQRLFGVFQRLHAQAQFPGTGVGLSIVRRVVHRHGGRVWASSSPGQGAQFCFALPLVGQKEPAEPAALKPASLAAD